MQDTEFDQAMVTAAFEQAALTGWRGLSLVEAARAAGLPLDRARARFPTPGTVLMRFGALADQAALAEAGTEPLPRDRLFDLLMRRFDVLQQHRAGMVALMDTLPTAPALSLMLSAATLRSMGWMLEAAGVSAAGATGRLRVAGLAAVWLYALRAWKTDTSADLAGTMAALDKALDQAEKFSGVVPGGPSPAAEAEPSADPMPDTLALESIPPPEAPAAPPASPPVLPP